jgi:hypothetical protein
MLRMGWLRQGRMIGLVMTTLAALGVGHLGSTARADIIFDSTGSGNTAAPSLGTIDLAVGNSLAFNSIPLTVGSQFTTYFQARVSEFTNLNDGVIPFSGREFTLVLAVREMVETVTGTTLTFRSIASPVNFLELYAGAPNSNDLNGTGFNDGTRILSATPLAGVQGGFTIDPTKGTANFDQRGTNDFSATRTVVGGSSTGIAAQVNSVNTAYFPGGIPASTIWGINFTEENRTPFNQVNPSRRFVSAAGGATPDLYNVSYVAGGTIPYTLGPINGFVAPVPRPTNLSFQFQSDASISFFETLAPLPVPEPGTISLALTGSGLISLAALRARRRRCPFPSV